MKITIPKDQIITGLQAVQNIVGSRTTLPILSNVLIRAENGLVEFTATDLDVTIICKVKAEVLGVGSSTLPVKRLFGIARELPGNSIEFETDSKAVATLQAGGAFYRIHGLGAEEFPPVATFGNDRKLTLPLEKFKSMLRRSSIAMSNDESRFILNGIFMKFATDKITMVATDGRRLAMDEEDSEGTGGAEGSFILPTKACNELNRLIQGAGEVDIRFTDNQACFTLRPQEGAPIVLISKLVEGSYPNYQQVIPKETKERIALNREEFHQALRRAEFMTSEKSNSVKLSFGKNRLDITANTPEIGEGRESLAINYKGREIAIAFNPAYLMDPLKVVETDEVFMELTDELSPGLLKINGPFLYVLMPMRTS
ncbi:MAG: DNA polymerase III subunit beta [Verrucomicrobia bacterium]|nr:DNA polymerase III subunit beta [Verrucomicrobiota bacterium]